MQTLATSSSDSGQCDSIISLRTVLAGVLAAFIHLYCLQEKSLAGVRYMFERDTPMQTTPLIMRLATTTRRARVATGGSHLRKRANRSLTMCKPYISSPCLLPLPCLIGKRSPRTCSETFHSDANQALDPSKHVLNCCVQGGRDAQGLAPRRER